MQQHSKSEAIGLASMPAPAKIDKMKNAEIMPFAADSEIDSHAGERVKKTHGLRKVKVLHDILREKHIVRARGSARSRGQKQ